MGNTCLRRSRLRRGLAAAGALAAVLVLLFSCSPDSGFNTIRDYDVVATFYDPEVDFTEFGTYAMPDTIVQFRDPADTAGSDLSREYDGLVLDLVRTNLEALGYTEASDPIADPPDVYVVVWVTLSEWLANSSEDWQDMWDWYLPPSWGPDWGTYYPYPVEMLYRAGSIFIDMFNKAEVEEPEEPYIRIYWTGSINGIMVDTPGGAEDRLTDNINQAFEQSPYLATD